MTISDFLNDLLRLFVFSERKQTFVSLFYTAIIKAVPWQFVKAYQVLGGTDFRSQDFQQHAKWNQMFYWDSGRESGMPVFSSG